MLATARDATRDRPGGDAPHRLEDHGQRDLAAAVLALTKHDRHFDGAQAGFIGAASKVDLEAVPA